jgi:hypothetical protein
MKQYYALRIIAAITSFLGWIILIGGGIVGVIAFQNNAPSVMGLSELATVVAIAAVVLLNALIFMASGQLLEAVADIATNSGHWPHIEANTARIDQMSSDANRRERLVPMS